jgi:hypothetical protein
MLRISSSKIAASKARGQFRNPGKEELFQLEAVTRGVVTARLIEMTMGVP